MAAADFTPLTDHAVDALLDTRVQLAGVRDSTLAGCALWNCMAQAIRHVDDAIKELRR